MGIYNQYTLSSTKKLICFYCCPKCGNHNLFLFPCSAKSNYNDRGAFLKSTIEERKAVAEAELSLNLRQKIDNILYESNIRNYKPANIHYKCQKCQTVEPWAKYHIPFISSISAIAKYILFITGVFATWVILNGGWNKEVVVIPAISAIIWMLCVVTDKINTSIRNTQVQKIDPLNLPIIEENPALIKEKIKKYLSDSDILCNQSKNPF